MSYHAISMSDKRYDEITELVTNSYKNACILFIDEVDNPTLQEQYDQYKRELAEKRKGNIREIQAFHGTHAKYITIISDEGFDPNKNVTSAYGKGTYFAKDANYSQQYMKSTDSKEISYMFLAKIALGKCVVGPGQYSSQDFDNYVDNQENPKIFVCPYKYAAYPQYVIGFYKNAHLSNY